MRAKSAEKSRSLMAVSALLSAVPFPNAAMTVEEVGQGLVVTVPFRRPAWLVPPLSWILPMGSVRQVQLDEPGKTVLNLCDGRRTVEQVIESFAALNKLSFRESQLAVTQFLKELLRRGIIALVGLDSSPASRTDA